MKLPTPCLRFCFQLAAACTAAALLPPRAARAAGPAPAAKESVVRLEEFEVAAPRASALTAAPTDSRLDARQPQSVIPLQYIANNMVPTADYATIANIAPSVANVETNGPGLSEAKHTTIRGIDDGGYNVTFDGIPFGDYNTFTHHTTSYFPAKLLGQVVVDRGPGTASTIGNATFGGTLALSSKDPRTALTLVPTLSCGSWATRLYHFEANSGLLPGLNQASVIASYQYVKTEGYRTNADMDRSTYYVKYLQPIGPHATITLLSSVNQISFGNPGTVTQAQIDTFGRNFGLKDNNDANHLDTLNRRYNYQDKTADFEYLGIDAALPDGWKVDNKVYTYSYNNKSHEKPKAGTGAIAGTMLGSVKLNEYRTYGDTFAVAHTDAIGTFKAGVWYDRTTNHRYTYGVNYDTTGANAIDLTATALYAAPAPGGNPATLPGRAGYNYKYLLVDKNTTWQPFVEYQWQITPDFDLNGGVKYSKFTRDFDATVNQTAGRQALKAKRADEEYTPSLTAHYLLAKDWSAYAEIAKGFQAPSEANSFYVANANFSSIAISPQTSTNYQVGTVFKHDRFNADLDVYRVDFKNYAYSGPTDSTGDPSYYGIAKGAYYDGVEAEATFAFGGGFSAYANGSINEAKFKGSDMDMPTVPRHTAALGVIYDRDGFFGSLMEKYVGSWVVYNTITNPDIPGAGASRSAHSASYWIGDLALGYGRNIHGSSWLKSYKVRLEVGNVFNRKVQVLDTIGANPAAAYTTDAFNVLPVRNYFLTVAVEF